MPGVVGRQVTVVMAVDVERSRPGQILRRQTLQYSGSDWIWGVRVKEVSRIRFPGFWHI